jgi:hypothetical protein
MGVTVVQTELFSFGGKNYEIKVIRDSHGYTVQAFLDGHPAKMSAISVGFPDTTEQNWNWWYNKNPPMRLIEMIEDDITNGYGAKRENQ